MARATFWAALPRLALQALPLAGDTARVQLPKQIIKAAAALGRWDEPRRCGTGNGFESSERHGGSCGANTTVLQILVVKPSYRKDSVCEGFPHCKPLLCFLLTATPPTLSGMTWVAAAAKLLSRLGSTGLSWP